jgi:hypothetical protein
VSGEDAAPGILAAPQGVMNALSFSARTKHDGWNVVTQHVLERADRLGTRIIDNCPIDFPVRAVTNG